VLTKDSEQKVNWNDTKKLAGIIEYGVPFC